MTISAISGNVQMQGNDQSASNAQNVTKQQNSLPQDTVTISSTARAMQSSNARTDVDHDGDSK
jgi:outer membrane murein-binding lipoprotein Lpp